MAKEVKKEKKFSIEIDVLGKKWKKSGNTMLGVLKKFGMDSSEIKGSGFLKATSGEKEFIKRFNAVQLRRIVCNKLVKAHWAKNLELLIK